MASGKRVELMLKSLGFRGNPFTLREADREGLANLASYFFHHPLFFEILGTTENLESAIVLASRGAGKTTFRQSIQHYCRTWQEPVKGVLDVPYVDFARPLAIARKQSTPVDIWLHVDEILRCGVSRWLEVLDETKAARLLNNWRRDEMALLKGYLMRYSPLFRPRDYGRSINLLFRRIARERLGQDITVDVSPLLTDNSIISSLPEPLKVLAQFLIRLARHPARPVERHSYSNLMRDFVQLSELLGYSSVYVLVDRLDETSLLSNTEEVASFIAPLLGDIVLLDQERLAFKIFLPQHLAGLIARRINFRSKRLVVRYLVWSADDLLQLLSRRLLAFSNYSSMQILCELPLGAKIAPLSARYPRARYIDVSLVQSANHLPRDLILRCRKLLEVYEMSERPGLISEEHLQEAIEADLGSDEPNAYPTPELSIWASRPVETPSASSNREDEVVPGRGLFIDRFKRVWRNGQPLTIQPSATEFRLLAYLSEHRYEICAYEDVVNAVWERGADIATLNTTLRRLRGVVEIDPANPSFLLRHTGRGIQLTDGLFTVADTPTDNAS